MSKVYIKVADEDVEHARRLGAQWDPDAQMWYCLAGSTLALIYKWRKTTPQS